MQPNEPCIQLRMRTTLLRYLPAAFDKTLSAYKKFSSQPQDQEASEFKKHHDACKIALSHVQELIKIAEKIRVLNSESLKKEQAIDEAMLQTLIENAQKELNSHKI